MQVNTWGGWRRQGPGFPWLELGAEKAGNSEGYSNSKLHQQWLHGIPLTSQHYHDHHLAVYLSPSHIQVTTQANVTKQLKKKKRQTSKAKKSPAFFIRSLVQN